uniref:peptidyl-tRNA hydrolase n=1 Tax=Daucus carota subsp. sativus TaxID=79200 RepID=A0A166FRB8_DAUCS
MPANSSQLSKRGDKRGKEWLAVNFKPENFIPGLIIGFVFGFLFDMAKPLKDYAIGSCSSLSRTRKQQTLALRNPNEELKMVLVVRQDLKMGSGKIASQCAHAATGLYSELIQSQRALVRQWEHCGQAKIVVTCKNQQEMNKLKEMAENIGLPTYMVADAGRTQFYLLIADLCAGKVHRPLAQMGALQSLLPLHSAVASARLTSCLGIDSKGSRSLSQGMLCSANPGV